MSFERALWLFPAVVTLHNLEEAIWLPRWAARDARWPSPGSHVFLFAVTVLTLFAYTSTWLALRSGRQSFWMYVVFGYMVAVLINVLVPHLAMTVLRRSYMPGLGTGLLFILPVLWMLVAHSVKEQYVSGLRAVSAAIAVPLVLLCSIPALFALGKAMKL